MMDFWESENKFSARSAIYGAIVTLGLIFALFCLYALAMAIKFVVLVLGPVVFTILSAGFGMLVLTCVVQHIKRKRMKGERTNDDA